MDPRRPRPSTPEGALRRRRVRRVRRLSVWKELRAASHQPARLVWQRDDAPPGLERSRRAPAPTPLEMPEFHLDEALTNLCAMLEWLEAHADVNPVLAAAIREAAASA